MHASFNHRRSSFSGRRFQNVQHSTAERHVSAVTHRFYERLKVIASKIFNRSFPKFPIMLAQWICLSDTSLFTLRSLRIYKWVVTFKCHILQHIINYKQRIEALVRRGVWLGLYRATDPTPTKLQPLTLSRKVLMAAYGDMDIYCTAGTVAVWE